MRGSGGASMPRVVLDQPKGCRGGWGPRLARGLVHLQLPPGTNQYMQRIIEELIFAQIHVGPVFAPAQIQENIIEELFLKYIIEPSQICIRTFAPSLCLDTGLYSHTPGANT